MWKSSTFKYIIFCVVFLSFNGEVPAGENEGWISCFNGRDLSGWTLQDNPDSFRVVSGEIHGIAGKSGWLCTKREYEDFDLRLEFKIGRGKNSGVFLHAPLWGRASSLGMEIQILGDFGHKPTSDSSGAIYAVEAPSKNALNPEGEWNHLAVSWRGAHLKVTLNGEVIHDLNVDQHPALRDRLRVGHIGLQNHGDEVCFRNIWIRPGLQRQYRVSVQHFPRVLKGQRPALSLDRLSVLHVVAMTPEGLVYSSGRTGESWTTPVLLPGTKHALEHDIFNFPGEDDPLIIWSDGAHAYVSLRSNGGWKAPEQISGPGKAFSPTVIMVAQSEHYLAYVEDKKGMETIHLHVLEPKHQPRRHKELVTAQKLIHPQGILSDLEHRGILVTWGGIPPNSPEGAAPCIGLVFTSSNASSIGPVHWLTSRKTSGSVVPCFGLLDETFSLVRPVSQEHQMAWIQSNTKKPIADLGPDTEIGVWSGPRAPIPVCRPLGNGYVAAWTRRYTKTGARRVGWTWYNGARWIPQGPFPGCAATGDPDSGFSGRTVYLVWPGADRWIHAERISLARTE